MPKIKKRNKQTQSRIKPRESGSGSTNALVPIFSFEFMGDDEHCIPRCGDIYLAALLKKLKTLSKITWGQIQSTDRHGLGCEIIDKKSINKTIPTHLEKEDINILSIRFSGKKAMVGYRENRIFNILWIDYNFLVYNHN